MSLCFRTISNKFTSFVNTRKQVTKIDRQLPKNVKSSSFLDEFLGLQTSVDTKINLTDRNLDVFTDVYSFHQNLLPILVKSHQEWEKTLVKNHIKNENEILRIEQSLTDHSRFSNTEPMLINLLLYDITTNCKGTKDKSLARDKSYIANNDIDIFINNNRFFSNKQIIGAIADNNLEQNTILLTNGGNIKAQEASDKQAIKGNEGRPSKKQLEHIFTCLSNDLPNFFVKSLDYTIYSTDIIFINNIKGITTKGMFNYVKQIALVRTIAHLKFAYIKLNVLKITIDPEDDTIKVRWRISGITGLKALFTLWRFKLWKMKEALNDAEVWYDGFSTYYVDVNGKVYKHVIDKLMPDQNQLFEKGKPEVATKLAMFIGLQDFQILNSNEFISKLKYIMLNVK
ncbi:uncharacterized protein LOC122637500 [Vespula pensylvanica]|uniref:Uncharacterized protein n=1 Tax=Vespula pensylvanica TaxID=30213 RepID=A0A834PBU3_VESPE|nr:uncharacterized protein LOC122637500 [Vespula pensylvanica]KAF7435093.1 hypothetical protein H0235_003284 [Vespula pensylvanica]